MKQTITITLTNHIERARRGIEWKAELAHKGGSISETGKANDEETALANAKLAAETLMEEFKHGH